jgi:hypothetical protein
VRKTQLRRLSKFASALCAIPQLQTLPLRTITVRKKLSYKIKKSALLQKKINRKMHFYQNKHGRLVALLVFLLTQVHNSFIKKKLFEVVCGTG